MLVGQADTDDFPAEVKPTLPPRTPTEKSTKRHLVVVLEGAHLETGKTKRVLCTLLLIHCMYASPLQPCSQQSAISGQRTALALCYIFYAAQFVPRSCMACACRHAPLSFSCKQFYTPYGIL